MSTILWRSVCVFNFVLLCDSVLLMVVVVVVMEMYVCV